jgi:hypothetical protein
MKFGMTGINILIQLTNQGYCEIATSKNKIKLTTLARKVSRVIVQLITIQKAHQEGSSIMKII